MSSLQLVLEKKAINRNENAKEMAFPDLNNTQTGGQIKRAPQQQAVSLTMTRPSASAGGTLTERRRRNIETWNIQTTRTGETQPPGGCEQHSNINNTKRDSSQSSHHRLMMIDDGTVMDRHHRIISLGTRVTLVIEVFRCHLGRGSRVEGRGSSGAALLVLRGRLQPLTPNDLVVLFNYRIHSVNKYY
ncbi:unnamed protein product [Danaus chrysippus]|uniref:(African queen) hypothetical protein n=1 Tax=Danaus chrysippus TaxID=151541 RepID=A0A8J2R568_9NEOP|nr:unnamed protein product [Danaus chrysippus]